jgi:hypothetical protein
MTKLRIIFLTLLLLIPALAYSQTSRSQTEANRSWLSFWSQFSAAMKKKDRVALRRMMSSDFEWALDGVTPPNEVFQMMDRYNYWRPFQKSVANGVKICGYNADDCRHKTRPARRTKSPDWLLFEFQSDGKWRWVALMGD